MCRISLLLWMALVPAAAPPGDDRPARLPHRERIAPRVDIAGFSERYHCANCGWIALTDETLLIDVPRGMAVPEYLALVKATTGKPVRTLVLTNIQDSDIAIVGSLLDHGITHVFTSTETRASLLAAGGSGLGSKIVALADRTPIGDATVSVEFQPFDHAAAPAGAAVWVAGQGVLFAGPMVVHGPRASLTSSHTADWIAALLRLEALAPKTGRPRLRVMGRPRAARSPAPILDRTPPTGRIRDLPGPAPERAPRPGAIAGGLHHMDPLRQPDARRPRPRLSRTDRPQRPVSRSAADRLGLAAACTDLDR